jgi:peptide/nickel transport system ATP-binding protein
VEKIVEISNLGKSFPQKGGEPVTILRDVNLTISAGQTLCVMGESGCGKTTLGKIIAGLSDYTTGSYKFCGKEVSGLRGKEWDTFRESVQLIHQNPYESLNPALMVFDIIANPIKRHRKITKIPELYEEVTRLLKLVGLTPVEDFVDKYPAHLSGGQRQRVSIARILAMNPKLIVVDEATSMIDTSLRISLLSTMKQIQQELGVAYFFITHDLALGKYFAKGQEAMVMYLGRAVEVANMDDLVANPCHPYSRAIISAAVGDTGILEDSGILKYSLKDADIASFNNMPTGCPLHPRCPECVDGVCRSAVPEAFDVGEGHRVACYLYQNKG